LEELGYAITVYSCDSDRPPFYQLEKLKGVRLVRIKTLRRRDRLFAVLRRATLDMALWLDAFQFVRGTYRELEESWRGERVIAMNPVVDLLPAIWLKRRRRGVWVGGCVRERAALGLSRLSPWARPFFSWLEKRSLMRADVVLANGYDTHDELQARGIPSTVIPNGVDWERFASDQKLVAETRELRELKEGGRAIVMMVGTLWWGKGVDSLLQAANRMVRDGCSDFQVVFVGKGRQDRYRREVRKLDLQDRVTFAGEQKDVPAFLHLADVSVNLSGGLGMSMAALEAMAAGRAVAAWDSAIYRQLIRHGQSGILVEEGNVEALAHELAHLINEPGRRDALGRAAQAEAKRYEWRRVAERLMEVVLP
jgi:glycosyltransferase involved in cell wall biosynthesis